MSHRIFDMREVEAQLMGHDENEPEYVVASRHGDSDMPIWTSHQQTDVYRSGSALSSPRSSVGILSRNPIPRSLPTDATSVYSSIRRREHEDRPFNSDKRDIEVYPLQRGPDAGKVVDYQHLLSQADEDPYLAATANPSPSPAEELKGIGSHVHGAKRHRPATLDSSIDVLEDPDVADAGDEVAKWDENAIDMKTKLESIDEECAMDHKDSCSSSGKTRPSRRELAAKAIRLVDQSIFLPADKNSRRLHGPGKPQVDENGSTAPQKKEYARPDTEGEQTE